jgi:hypothetical protein
MPVVVPRHLLVLLPVLLLGASAVACRKSAAPAPTPTPLVSDEDLRHLKLELEVRVKHAGARRCPRPVLRGTELPGPAAPELTALLGGTPETRACLERLADGRNIADLWLLDEHVPAAIRDRDGPTPRPLATVAERAPELRATAAACEPLYTGLQATVAHLDACSPWRPGLACADSHLPRLHFGQAVAAGAWFRLADGKLREGLELALDGLRLLQDLERGGTQWIDAATGAAATLPLVAVLEAGLTAAAAEPELLADIGAQLGLLLAGEPLPAELLAGESLGGMVTAADPAALGTDAAPAVVRCRTAEVPAAPGPAGTTAPGPARDVQALAWLTLGRMAEQWQNACGDPAAPPLACRDGLDRLYQDWREQARRSPDEFLRQLLGRAVVADGADEGRHRLVETLLAPGADPARWIAAQGRRRFLLAALRLQAAWQRQAAAAGSCPAAAAFDAAPLAELRADPFSGRPIKVDSDGEGGFVFRPPVGLVVGTSAESKDVAVRAACPPPVVVAPPPAACLAEWKIDSGESYLDEVRGRLRASMDDFQDVFAAVEVGGEAQEPMQAGGAFRIADRALLWFDRGRNAVVLDATHFTDLQAIDVPRACLEAGRELPVGRFLSRDAGALPPRQLVEFLIRAGVLQTFWHVGSELCLRAETDAAAGYEAVFDGINVYFTNEENRDPFSFAVRVAPDGTLTLVTR